MTNKEDKEEQNGDPRLAALLAVHLVGQVLDEAYDIVSAAKESGEPWSYLSMVKKIRSEKIYDKDADATYVASKGDCDDKESDNNVDSLTNTVVTSTPQKTSDVMSKAMESKVGQGDQGLEMQDNELSNYTSMFINHLFDMSEVEKVIIYDDNECISNNDEQTNLPLQDITKFMESYVNTALTMALVKETQETEQQIIRNSSRSTEHSSYSFLSDAFILDVGKDVAFIVNDGLSNVKQDTCDGVTIEEVITELADVKTEDYEKNDNTLYENAYLTLNRDYEQYSEEDGDPVLQDPKGLSMQEVELMTAHTSDDDGVFTECEKKPKQLEATSAVSASANGSRKSSLVSRCRTQGARLLACLRGWWRRKTPGKRKEFRVSGPIRGLCPLSPDARRRAASLLDQRHLCSPSPSRSVIWKFNTVNEALVNSSRWKEYTFDIKPDECGEY